MKTLSSEWSRRKFLATIGGAGTFLALSPMASLAFGDVDPRVAALVAKTIGVDTHNHVDVPLITAELPGPMVDLAVEMKKSGLSAICMTFAVDYQPLKNPGDAYDRFINGLTAMDKVLEANAMHRALNFADIQAARKNNTPVVIQSVEGGHFLEGQIDRLAVAYSRGLRHLGLLHDNDASTPLGDVFTNPARWGGLTAFGADVIRQCNKLGILVDLSHSNVETVDAALKVATKPVLVSHTGLDTQVGTNERMATMMRPRLINKERAKVVADAGGVIGVWTHLADTALEYAHNIRALVDVVGVDHVCIGTDTKMTPAYRSPGNVKPRPQRGDANNRPEGAPRDNQGPNDGDKKRVGERTNEAWADQQTGFYYAVVDALLKTGFQEDEIGKIGGGNFCRVFDAATAGH